MEEAKYRMKWILNILKSYEKIPEKINRIELLIKLIDKTEGPLHYQYHPNGDRMVINGVDYDYSHLKEVLDNIRIYL